MSCECKNKEYHPCQHGYECQCGGKCKQDNYLNVVGSLDEFKDESKSVNKGVWFLVGALTLTITGYLIYRQLKKSNYEI